MGCLSSKDIAYQVGHELASAGQIPERSEDLNEVAGDSSVLKMLYLQAIPAWPLAPHRSTP